MKFLCRNCKAKYQIADEKVAGRTLRMTCQQCGEPIVVRGPARQPSVVARPVAPAPIAVPAPASLLGTEPPHHLAPAREQLGASEEWHVAIHDAPVGPLRRDEVARKIAQGAIDRESLAWREGMDDWMAIKHIAELSSLFSSHGSNHASGALSVPAPMIAPAPGVRSEHSPIGGRQVVAVQDYVRPSDPHLAEVALASSIPVAAVAPVATVAPAPAAAQMQQANRQPWAQMFALVSGGAFILAAGALLGVRVLAPNNSQPPAAAAAPIAAAPVAKTEESAAPAPKPNDGSGNVIELGTQEIDGARAEAAAAAARKPATASAAVASQQTNANDKKKLTAEQREMLERMGGDFDRGATNIRTPSENSRPAGAQAGQLTAQQLQAVVLSGRKNLQRCYETALRGANSNDTVRLDVDIQVSPHGNVTTVHTSGKGLPGMDDCIVRTVKMWRFPTSGEITQTRFPVVFQPGA